MVCGRALRWLAFRAGADLGLRAVGFLADVFFAFLFAGLFLRVAGLRAAFALEDFAFFFFEVALAVLEAGVRLRVLAVPALRFFFASILRRPF